MARSTYTDSSFGGTKMHEKKRSLRFYGTLHTNACGASCVLHFWTCLKSKPKIHLLIEINGKCSKKASKPHTWCVFLSHMPKLHRCMLGVRNAEKRIKIASKTNEITVTGVTLGGRARGTQLTLERSGNSWFSSPCHSYV